MTRLSRPLLLLACMAMTSCATQSGPPAPDKADAATAPEKCPPSFVTAHDTTPTKPKGASILAPQPDTPEAAATEMFLQWIQSVVAHSDAGDAFADKVKGWCAS